MPRIPGSDSLIQFSHIYQDRRSAVAQSGATIDVDTYQRGCDVAASS